MKADLNQQKIRPNFHERGIWFSSAGVNVGFEQDGRGEHFLRPFLIIKKFNNLVCLAVPLTKNQKKGKYYFQFKFAGNSNVSTAILSQIKLMDAKRLQYKIGEIGEDDFRAVITKIKAFLP